MNLTDSGAYTEKKDMKTTFFIFFVVDPHFHQYKTILNGELLSFRRNYIKKHCQSLPDF